jgi:hypothetical protein
VSTVTAPASVREAMDMVRAGLAYLAAADATQMAAGEQARCLRGLEQATSVTTAARTSILGGFTAGQGYAADGDYSPRTWLIHQTNITRGAAAGHTAWIRRAAAHPQVAQALAAGEISESFARTICAWTDKLPENCRQTADEILLTAALTGLGLPDLAELAGEIYARAPAADSGGNSDSEDGDGDKDVAFDDRGVTLATTFQGAGVLHGDLTPECAEVVRAVLDALSVPADAEDTRSQAQRYHDGLQEAMRRLAASDLLPQRAGQPVRAWVHISLAELLAMDGSSALQQEWTARVRAAWAAHRAGASVEGGESGAWLDGEAAAAVACDAAMAPYVTGDVNPAALDELIRLCVQFDELRRSAGTRDGDTGENGASPAAPPPDTTRAWEALEQAVIGKAVDLLAGPGGLASFLRRRQLGTRLGGPSLPLDIGYAATIPAGIRHAVILRDRRCRWAGGCSQPAAACEVHHVKHKADGGKTSTRDCVLLCSYHHQVMIHRQGWTLVLNPDGTTTAWNKDRTKVLHSHGPPARAG